jgi:uncharacterized membrane protein
MSLTRHTVRDHAVISRPPTAGEKGSLVIVIADVLAIVFVVACGVLAERAVARFRSLNPQFCSIYEPNFWWHERLWKRASSSPTAPRSAPAAPSGSQHSSTMA